MEQEEIYYALRYVIPDNSKEKKNAFEICDHKGYEKYSEYIEEYFNNFLQTEGLFLKCSNVYSKNLFTLITFLVRKRDEIVIDNQGDEILENIVDILGLSCLENIDSELIVKNRISGFLNHGFFVIKEKEMKNWTFMSAIKDADYFAKIILNEEEAYEH